MKIVTTILLLISNICFSQIKYVNHAETPADLSASSITTVVYNTAGFTCQTGDLVVMMALRRGSVNVDISETGGQSWTKQFSIPGSPGPVLGGSLFWCTFNGTWTADPSVLFDAGTSTSLITQVFRPTNTSKVWGVDPNSTGIFTGGTAPSSPFTVSIGSWSTPSNASTVALAIWATDDDNTWGSLSGSGWVSTGIAQYRNTAGSDMSLSFAHYIQSSAGAIPTVSKNQATLGGDPYVIGKIIFYEYTPSALPRRVINITKR